MSIDTETDQARSFIVYKVLGNNNDNDISCTMCLIVDDIVFRGAVGIKISGTD